MPDLTVLQGDQECATCVVTDGSKGRHRQWLRSAGENLKETRLAARHRGGAAGTDRGRARGGRSKLLLRARRRRNKTQLKVRRRRQSQLGPHRLLGAIGAIQPGAVVWDRLAALHAEQNVVP